MLETLGFNLWSYFLSVWIHSLGDPKFSWLHKFPWPVFMQLSSEEWFFILKSYKKPSKQPTKPSNPKDRNGVS